MSSPNLCLQSSFENAVTKWASDVSSGGTSDDFTPGSTGWAKFGAKSCHVKGTQPADTTTRRYGLLYVAGTAAIPVDAETVYTLSSYVKTVDSSINRGYFQRISWYTAAGALISTTSGTEVADEGADGLRLVDTFTSPATAAFARPGIYLYTGTANDVVEFYCDAVQLEEGPDATAYVPNQSELPGSFSPVGNESLLFSVVLLRPGNSPLVLTRQAKVLNYTTVVPGGFGSCNLELPGEFRRWAREIPYQAMLQVCDGDTVLFEGRVEDRGMAWNENGVATRVSIFGLQRRLSDDSITRGWLQRETVWQSSGDLQSGSVTTGQFDPTDLTRVGLDIKYAAQGPYENYVWAYTLLPYQLRRVIGYRSAAPANVYWQITHGVKLGAEAGEVLGGGWGDASLTKTAFDYAVDGGLGVLFGFLTDTNAGGEMQIEDLRMLATDLVEDVSGGMYAGKILADLIAQVTGILPGDIDAGSDFALPSCAAATRRYVREIVDEICSYYTREWAVWEGGAFDWKQPALDEVQWICHTADFLPGTEITGSSDDCYERVFVLYTNAGAADNGFPGEQSATATEQRNPFVGSGEHRDALISPGFAMTDLSALQLAAKLLGDYGKYPGARGQIILPASKLVQHATLGALPARLIRAGDNITVPDLPKTDILVEGRDGETQFHIVTSEVDLVANRVTLQIEGQSKRADALLARLSAVTSLLGG